MARKKTKTPVVGEGAQPAEATAKVIEGKEAPRHYNN